MGFEEGFKFKKKKPVKSETARLETVQPEIVQPEATTEGEVEIYGLEVSASVVKSDIEPTNIKNNGPRKLKIPIINLKDV